MSPHRVAAMLLASFSLLVPRPGSSQGTTMAGAELTLTLADAQERARRVSPALRSAREAATAADARARQASAFANPTISFQREQTSRGTQENSQNIVTVDQPIEFGLRPARREAAAHRSEAAAARVRDVESQLALDVTRAYADALATDRRAALAHEAATAFERARRVSDERVAAGDISGYANRRIRMEAARYAVLRAQALLGQGNARRTLAALIAPSTSALGDAALVLVEPTLAAGAPQPVDSLVALALTHRDELVAIRLDGKAAQADAALVSRERWPTPVITGGLKTEEQTGIGALSGIAVGVALPLPLWDRRRGAIDAAAADARRAESAVALVRRRIEFEVRDAAASLHVVDEQLALLRPVLGEESTLALRAAALAYTEGEIALVEWLDAVRAYHEAESAFATLRAELIIHRAALDRAVGLPLRRSAQ